MRSNPKIALTINAHIALIALVQRHLSSDIWYLDITLGTFHVCSVLGKGFVILWNCIIIILSIIPSCLFDVRRVGIWNLDVISRWGKLFDIKYKKNRNFRKNCDLYRAISLYVSLEIKLLYASKVEELRYYIWL